MIQSNTLSTRMLQKSAKSKTALQLAELPFFTQYRELALTQKKTALQLTKELREKAWQRHVW